MLMQLDLLTQMALEAVETSAQPKHACVKIRLWNLNTITVTPKAQQQKTSICALHGISAAN